MKKFITFFSRFKAYRLCQKNKELLRKDLSSFDKIQLKDIGVPMSEINGYLSSSCWDK